MAGNKPTSTADGSTEPGSRPAKTARAKPAASTAKAKAQTGASADPGKATAVKTVKTTRSARKPRTASPAKAAKTDVGIPSAAEKTPRPKAKGSRKVQVTTKGLAVGAAATVGIVAAGVAAAMGRKKVLKASTDVVDAIKTKLSKSKAAPPRTAQSETAAETAKPPRRTRRPGKGRGGAS